MSLRRNPVSDFNRSSRASTSLWGKIFTVARLKRPLHGPEPPVRVLALQALEFATEEILHGHVALPPLSLADPQRTKQARYTTSGIAEQCLWALKWTIDYQRDSGGVASP